ATVKDHLGNTVKTLLTGDDEQPSIFCNQPVTWDGTDSDGNPLPDGDYTIAVHAAATSGTDTADLSMPVTIDTRVPGAPTKPTFAQSVGANVDLEFTPTAGFDSPGTGNSIQSITTCFDFADNNFNSCTNIVNPSPDGKWRTTASTPGTGNADVTWSVY